MTQADPHTVKNVSGSGFLSAAEHLSRSNHIPKQHLKARFCEVKLACLCNQGPDPRAAARGGCGEVLLSDLLHMGAVSISSL